MQPGPPVTDPPVQGFTPRQATWLTRRQPKDVTAEEPPLLPRLLHAPAACAPAIGLAHSCAQLLRARQPAQLEAWWRQAATSALTAFQRIAQSCQRDSAAVKAGGTWPWSTSPVEGHIKRLKRLKRQMCGRARLDRRSRRCLLAPRERPAQAGGRGTPSQVDAAAAEPCARPAVWSRHDA